MSGTGSGAARYAIIIKLREGYIDLWMRMTDGVLGVEDLP